MDGGLNSVALWLPLMVAVAATVCTIGVHACAGLSTMLMVRRHFVRGRAGVSVRYDLPLIAQCVMMFMLAHVTEMAVWAMVLMGLGEFNSFAPAFYHSAVNYTTLGYGDVVMSPRWRLLGPLESVDGMMMFGLTTAVLFNLIIRLGQLRDPETLSWLSDDPSTQRRARQNHPR